MYSYATLTRARYEFEQGGNDLATTEYDKFLELLRLASKRIDADCKQSFMPEIRTRYYDVQNYRLTNKRYNTLQTEYPLLEVTGVNFGDTAKTLSDFRLFPRNEYPSYELQRKRSTGYFDATGLDDSYEITGVWGYRSRYDVEAWIDSGDFVQGSLNATDTTINVQSITGSDGNNFTPRFDIGMLIRIEDEYCIITDTDTSAPTQIEVIRGVRGSTAAAHDANTAIEVFYPEPDIVRACMLIASYNYNNRGNFNRVQFDAATGITTEQVTVPTEAQRIIANYKKIDFYTVTG